MIEYVRGDITSVTKGMILHGCDASGVFGSGVAYAIRKKWVSVYETFLTYTPTSNLLGLCVPVRINESLVVANCYTQERYGNDGKVYASLEDIRKSLLSAYMYAKDNGISEISLPKIGCGLGGLLWEDVEIVVRHIAEQYPSIITKVYYI